LWSTQLWDSSAWLATESPLGTLLHALVGYHAQPSGMQVVAYAGVLLLIYVSTRSLLMRAKPVS
jgi:high-affinity iron transporter